MNAVVGITIGHECPGKTKWVDPKKDRGTVAKFRKKPVVIDAVVAARDGEIETLEGVMTYKEGDFIITGVKGERYPCKPDIFRATYEPVDYDAELLLDIADEREKSGAFLEYEFIDYPRQEELKVDPLQEISPDLTYVPDDLKDIQLFEEKESHHLICGFCPAREKLYPWPIPQTTTTEMLCRQCWEKEANMTIEEMWPLVAHFDSMGENEKSEEDDKQ